MGILQKCALQRRKTIMHASELNLEVAVELSNRDKGTMEEDIEEIEEEGAQAINLPIYMVHKMLSSRTNSMTQVEDDWKRIGIFHTRVSHKGKTLNVIIDNDIRFNVISTEAMENMKLQKEKH